MTVPMPGVLTDIRLTGQPGKIWKEKHPRGCTKTNKYRSLNPQHHHCETSNLTNLEEVIPSLLLVKMPTMTTMVAAVRMALYEKRKRMRRECRNKKMKCTVTVKRMPV